MNIFELILIQPLTNGLALFYKVFGQNMGVAIVAFSLALRLLLTPLTKPYMESMKKMKEYSPQLAKLKEKHKGDKQKQMKAQADFYKEKGINPGAGCLPYIIQIIILIALYNVFNNVLNAQNIVENFNRYLYEPLKFAANEIIHTQFLYFDVTKVDAYTYGISPIPLPGPIVLLSAVAQFLAAKMASPYIERQAKLAKKTKGKEDDVQVAMQNSFVYTMPLMTLFIGTRFPSGLALYWLLFSAFQVYQQYRSTGWGAVTPWIKRMGLLKSA